MVETSRWRRRWRGALLTLFALEVAAIGWRAVRAEGEVIPSPGSLAFRGTLERGGVPFEGTATVTVRLFDSAALDTELCAATRPVAVSAGRFVAELPEACADAVRRHPEAWLAVSADVGDGPQAFPPQRLHAAPYAVTAANGVPVGGIVPWFGEPGTDPLPPGFEVCDGAEITDPRSPLLGASKPDLRGRFLRGAAEGLPPGTAGGAERVTTSATPHRHRWVQRGGQEWRTYRRNGTSVPLFDESEFHSARVGDGTQMLRLAPGFDGSEGAFFTDTEEGGGHTHEVDVLPPFVAVTFLCRVF